MLAKIKDGRIISTTDVAAYVEIEGTAINCSNCGLFMGVLNGSYTSKSNVQFYCSQCGEITD